jgi:hypothetical protein
MQHTTALVMSPCPSYVRVQLTTGEIRDAKQDCLADRDTLASGDEREAQNLSMINDGG